MFIRVSINFTIFLVAYLLVVRPLRIQVTEKVVHPVLSTLFDDSAEPFLSIGGLSVQLKFQGINDRIGVITPFGALFYGIPFVLLFSAHNWTLVKTLTYYHVAVAFVLSILFSLFFMRWLWTFLPTDFLTYLTRLLGLIFSILALKRLYDEHTRIRKVMCIGRRAK